MSGEAASQRLGELSRLARQAAPGEFRQGCGIGLAGHQRIEHRPAGHAEHVGDDVAEFDIGALEQLVNPIGGLYPVTNQTLAMAGQIPQLANSAGGMKLARISPCASSSASHSQSLTSVFRPGTALM